MWTAEVHKWALVELGPERGGGTVLFDLEAWAPSTFDEEEEVVAAVFERMREAGVRRMTLDEARAR